ncbi:hypothetical protein HD806DRAFT_531037 [Xylariaceae sp. AK1471]|nr:hypothetical protein HD806DRAFT_531037 [Xylariaceae sp. AK1471]
MSEHGIYHDLYDQLYDLAQEHHVVDTLRTNLEEVAIDAMAQDNAQYRACNLLHEIFRVVIEKTFPGQYTADYKELEFRENSEPPLAVDTLRQALADNTVEVKDLCHAFATNGESYKSLRQSRTPRARLPPHAVIQQPPQTQILASTVLIKKEASRWDTPQPSSPAAGDDSKAQILAQPIAVAKQGQIPGPRKYREVTPPPVREGCGEFQVLLPAQILLALEIQPYIPMLQNLVGCHLDTLVNPNRIRVGQTLVQHRDYPAAISEAVQHSARTTAILIFEEYTTTVSRTGVITNILEWALQRFSLTVTANQNAIRREQAMVSTRETQEKRFQRAEVPQEVVGILNHQLGKSKPTRTPRDSGGKAKGRGYTKNNRLGPYDRRRGS